MIALWMVILFFSTLLISAFGVAFWGYRKQRNDIRRLTADLENEINDLSGYDIDELMTTEPGVELLALTSFTSRTGKINTEIAENDKPYSQLWADADIVDSDISGLTVSEVTTPVISPRVEDIKPLLSQSAKTVFEQLENYKVPWEKILHRYNPDIVETILEQFEKTQPNYRAELIVNFINSQDAYEQWTKISLADPNSSPVQIRIDYFKMKNRFRIEMDRVKYAGIIEISNIYDEMLEELELGYREFIQRTGSSTTIPLPSARGTIPLPIKETTSAEIRNAALKSGFLQGEIIKFGLEISESGLNKTSGFCIIETNVKDERGRKIQYHTLIPAEDISLLKIGQSVTFRIEKSPHGYEIKDLRVDISR